MPAQIYINLEGGSQNGLFNVFEDERYLPIAPDSGDGTMPAYGLVATGPPSDMPWRLALAEEQTRAALGGPIGQTPNPLLSPAWAASYLGNQPAAQPGLPPSGWEFFQP